MGLIDQYRILHAQGKFLGLSVLKFADEIGAICTEYGIETILDYGSGQGHQYMPPHSLDKKWGASVTMYDPAVQGLDVLPAGTFDLVLCSDVLEHVPLQELPALFENIFSRAKHRVFLTVCCRGAKKHLPNGQNAHVTIMPMDWWEAEIGKYATKPFVLRETP
jgi:hypothetical protein